MVLCIALGTLTLYIASFRYYVSRLRTRGTSPPRPDAEVAARKRRQPRLLLAARENRPDEIKRLV